MVAPTEVLLVIDCLVIAWPSDLHGAAARDFSWSAALERGRTIVWRRRETGAIAPSSVWTGSKVVWS
jgi:hypothetical protein